MSLAVAMVPVVAARAVGVAVVGLVVPPLQPARPPAAAAAAAAAARKASVRAGRAARARKASAKRWDMGGSLLPRSFVWVTRLSLATATVVPEKKRRNSAGAPQRG